MLCVFPSSFHPSTWEPLRKTFSLSSILLIHFKEKPMVGIFFLSNSKIKENENKTKNSPYEGISFIYLFSPCFVTLKFWRIFPEKKSKISQTCTRKQHFPKKKIPIFGFKRRQDLSWKTTGPCLHPMVEN